MNDLGSGLTDETRRTVFKYAFKRGLTCYLPKGFRESSSSSRSSVMPAT